MFVDDQMRLTASGLHKPSHMSKLSNGSKKHGIQVLPRVYYKERKSVLLSYGACNSCCTRFSKSMISKNTFKITVYILGTARAKVAA